MFVRLAVLAAVLEALIQLLDLGAAGFIIGLTLALLPVPPLVALSLWIDRHEPEPRELLATAFVWGATTAALASLLANTFLGPDIGALFGVTGEDAVAVVAAPIVEESLKAVVLAGLFHWRPREFDNVTDGIVYACMVGLGFAMTENVGYFGHAGSASLTTLAVTVGARALLAPFAHPLFTACTGAGLGLARETHRRALRLAAPPTGLAMAMLLHHLWNSASSFIAFYTLVGVPLFVAALVVVYASLRREARIVRANLLPLAADGALAPEEIEEVCHARRRARAVRDARRTGGRNAARRRRAFHRAATELAFLRWRSGRDGTAHEPWCVEEEARYRERLGELR
jgi:RsiW-degrading membrane proteinase PrsW (M82 family)